ncbi:MAG: metallophosphoesterase [Solirubrobacteraceae bacterium]
MVVSDLHLGARGTRDTLRSSAQACEALVGATRGVDRLVLLGDILELRQGPVREALQVALAVLGALGEALGPEGEVVIVPGNHDHHLLGGWRERSWRRQTPPLGLETAIDWRPGEPLAVVARALGPAQVRCAYPGVWLRDDVYALHGHYLDVHTTVPMFERLAAGTMARFVRRLPRGPRRPEDYEALLTPIYAWVHAVAQTGGPELGHSSHGPSAGVWKTVREGGRFGLRSRALKATIPVAVGALNRVGVGPLRAELSGTELRRASLRALGEVLSRLGVPAQHVIFGHTHRAGPLERDQAGDWRWPGGAELINSGCWVYEPGFLGPDPGSSPYRAGFAVMLADAGPPRLINLLDGADRPAQG